MSLETSMNIGKFKIGGRRVFVIAEIGNNHNGSVQSAIEMIDAAIAAGADCVKFQMRHLDEVYRNRTLKKDGEDLGTEYVLDLLERFELTLDEHRHLFEYCKNKDILYLCTPWDKKSIDVLEGFGVLAYKVASADLTNTPLLDSLIITRKPLILSTGMSSRDEVEFATNYLDLREANYVLLHCNSTYPAPFQDINLRWIEELKKIHPLVGYSGHERGTSVSLAATAMGASVIERHFTLDRSMEGPDHAASLEFDEFKKLVEGIRQIEMAMGDGSQRAISQGEMINRENLGKSLVAASDIAAGTKITPEYVMVKSPGQGLSPQMYEKLIGQVITHDMKKEDFFFSSDINGVKIEPKKYQFNRPWGVPIRYHDFLDYKSRIDPDFFEFHLSYSDMKLNPKDYLKGNYECGFVVHAPELFENSCLMDLASPDIDYRNYSITETQKVIDITRKLNEFFPNQTRPMIVANLGGFTMDQPLDAEKIPAYYERLAGSIDMLDLADVELLPQTMAPFPWHFGGQRYQNLFVKIDEIVHWCKRLNLRMCFDISHTSLTCNHLGYDFYEFSEKIAPITAHLHLGDARGLNGEGLQVGDGEIDFERLGKILQQGCANASFIPEIWQGHKNGGEGFWVALDRLEGVI